MIKEIKELNFPEYATLSQATVTLQDMGEKTITTQVRFDGQLTPDFSFDWEVEFKGEKYIMPLRKPQGAKDNTSLLSTVDLTFQHWAVYWLKKKFFFQYTVTEAGTALPDKWIVPLRLNLKDFCIYLATVCEYWYGDKITVDLNPEWVFDEAPTGIDISYSYVWDVLIKLYENYGVRWQISPKDDKDHYVIKVGYPTTEITHIFEYGFKGGLLKVERQVQNDDIRNMLLGQGGEKNLPACYFKKFNDYNTSFSPDPDWIPELSANTFTRLHGATFRSYIQGWNHRHYRRTSVKTAEDAYAPWAWTKGYNDSKFDPVEFVKDDISIKRYGELMGGLDDNDDIYPTLQGVTDKYLGRLDETVYIEPIVSDDVEGTIESEAYEKPLKGKYKDELAGTIDIAAGDRGEIVIESESFHVDKGMHGNIDEGPKTIKAFVEGKSVLSLFRKDIWGAMGKVDPFKMDVYGMYVEFEDVSLTVVDMVSGKELPAVGIPEGDYKLRLTLGVHNTLDKKLHVTVSCESAKLTEAVLDEKWSDTWDVWVKNIWDTEILSGETETEYAERVWRPILGDRTGDTAKIVFSDGWLSTSEDYEFVIADIPKFDESKDLDGVPSHWRIPLAKSEADLETTHLYVPSMMRQAKPGDHFFFTGIDLPHMYVVKAEIRLDNWKKDQLKEVSDIKPTWVVALDKVRIHNHGEADALVDSLSVGNTLRIADKRFIINERDTEAAYETLYLQSVTYTYNEPTENEANLLPDVEIVLSDKYEMAANPVALLQGDVDAIQRQVGSLSNIEQIIREVGDRLYLRKDGIPDRSMSPTEFASLLTSRGFRSGVIGGIGWGFFRDESGAWVLETDRINVRQDMVVNNLVINQISAQGGTVVESAARMEISSVEETKDGYICYFDRKDGSVANLFEEEDIAFCERYTSEDKALKFYKRKVVKVDPNYVILTKGYDPVELPDGTEDTGVKGEGVPEKGDVIAHYGNYTNKNRQYVKVRDVIGGGYERYIEKLDSVNAAGEEYYFIGRQSGMYNGRPRFYLGDSKGYIEYVNGELVIKGRIVASSSIGDKSIEEYIKSVVPPVTQEDIEGYVNAIVDPRIEGIQDQIDGVIETWFFNGAPTLSNYPASEWNTEALRIQHLGDLYYDNDTGTAYRFSQKADKTYYWNVITDDAITKALEAANSKRRVFTSQPTPPYDNGDLWVNATYPANTTAATRDPLNGKYYLDILRCSTSKSKGDTFAISDWGPASNYSDDSLAKEAKAAADAAKDAADKAQDEADSAKDRLDEWAADGVISPTEKQGIKDEIARIDADKAHITAEYTKYKLGSPGAYNNAYAAYRAQLVMLSADTPETIPIPNDFAAKQNTYYTERTKALNAISAAADKYADDAANAVENKLKGEIAGYEYLKEALRGYSITEGGLFLSSHIRLGHWEKVDGKPVMNKVYAGMNGIYTNDRSIATWWGGDMVDRFNAADKPITPVPVNAASALIRMDGTGYLAKGNIKWNSDGSGSVAGGKLYWDASGNVHIGSGIYIDSESSSETLGSVLNYMNSLNSLLVPVDKNGEELSFEDVSKAAGLKSKLDFYSAGGISCLGVFSGAGEGSGTVYARLDEWNDYTPANATDVLSAKLGYDLHERVNSNRGYINTLTSRLNTLASEGVTKIVESGSGNAVTGITQDGNTLNVVKGQSFLTSHQSLANYVTLTTEQTIESVKKFILSPIIKMTYTTGGIARGLTYADYQNNAIGGLGAYGIGINLEWFYLGWGASPWNEKTCISYGPDRFKYAGSDVMTAANIGNHAVTALGVNGNYLTWTKNGVPNNITVPYSTRASELTQNTRLEYGWNGLNYFNINGTAGCEPDVNDTPTTAWWHILRFNHANKTGYYTDLAIPFHANSLYYKRVNVGEVRNFGWTKVLDELNYANTLDSRYYTETEVNTLLNRTIHIADPAEAHSGASVGFLATKNLRLVMPSELHGVSHIENSDREEITIGSSANNTYVTFNEDVRSDGWLINTDGMAEFHNDVFVDDTLYVGSIEIGNAILYYDKNLDCLVCDKTIKSEKGLTSMA